MENLFTLLQLVVFNIILPTIDSFSDMYFCGKLATSNFRSSGTWAILVALPVFLNFVFTVAAFRKSPYPSRWKKWVEKVALLVQVWPQYFALTIIVDIINKKPGWEAKREYFNRNISTIEPFVEAIFQVVIKLCIWTVFTQLHLEATHGEENPLFSTTSGRILFYFTITSSMVTSLMGCIRFFKESPVRFLPQDGPLSGFFTLKYLLTFASVFFNTTAKVILLLLMVFYSLGVYGVLTPSLVDRKGIDLVGTMADPKCNNFSMVQACRDGSFQLRRHGISDKKVNWTTAENSSHWRVFDRLEGNAVLMFWDSENDRWWDGKEKCLARRSACTIQSLKNFCGHSACSGTRLYCTDKINILTYSRLVAVALWFLFNILPQILLASIFLLITEKRAFLRIFLLFPELILAPYLTNVMYGPQFGILNSKVRPIHVIQMKKSLCWVNVLLSVLGQFPTFYFLYSYLEEVNPKANFTNFLMHGYSNPLRRDFDASFIPPYTAILSLSIAILTLALLLHMDFKSPHPFLVPILRHHVSVTTHGLEEMEDPKEDEHKSSHNMGYKVEKVAVSKDSDGDWSIDMKLPSQCVNDQ